jgi:hypothetical protein
VRWLPIRPGVRAVSLALASASLGLLIAACAPRMDPPRSPGAPAQVPTIAPVDCSTYDYEGHSYAFCFPPGAAPFIVSTPGAPTVPPAVRTAIIGTETALPRPGTPVPRR